MKVRTKIYYRTGQSTKFDKMEGDRLFIRFDDTGEEQSVPVDDVEIWLDRSQKYMDFKTALTNRLILISGGPVQFVEH